MAGTARNVIHSKRSLALQTRCANDILNEYNPEIPDAGCLTQLEILKKKYPRCVPRTHVPTFAYNCHGLTFASRRTQIWSSADIAHIIQEDGYRKIEDKDILAGDVIVYQSQDTGEIEHSGIVIEKAKSLSGPLILSKWGVCHEVTPLLNLVIKMNSPNTSIFEGPMQMAFQEKRRTRIVEASLFRDPAVSTLKYFTPEMKLADGQLTLNKQPIPSTFNQMRSSTNLER